VNIVEIQTDDLIPYENNPRNNDEAVDKVASSIQQFGFKVPIVIDANNVIVAGHTRHKAAQKLGLKKIPCIVADDLTEEQVKAFRLADNKVSEFSSWDESKLFHELEMIDGLQMEEFGFLEFDSISPDDYGDSFSLPDGDKSEICTMTFTVHAEQKSLIEYAMSIVQDRATETFGNTNKNGNALYEVVREWAEQSKS
jgi:hypothetical protein